MADEIEWCQLCEEEGRFTLVAIVDGNDFLCYPCYQTKRGLGPPRDVYHEENP